MAVDQEQQYGYIGGNKVAIGYVGGKQVNIDPVTGQQVTTPEQQNRLQSEFLAPIDAKTGVAKPSRTPASMLDGNNGIATINSGQAYMNGLPQPTVPNTPVKPPEPPKPIEPAQTGHATYTNTAGQEFNFTQDQLNTPQVQEQIKNLTYVKNDPGINVAPNNAQNEYDTAEANVETLSKDFQNYNVNIDPDFIAQANDIKQNYAKLKAEMAKTNESRKRAYETLGMRGGTSQYAGNIQMGVEGEELNQANSRLSELSSQESSAITAAKIAFKNNKFQEFNAKVGMLKDIRDEKGKALDNVNKALVAYQYKQKTDQEMIRAKLENNQLFTNKANDEINRLAFTGLDANKISPIDKQYYEEKFGLPAGGFDKYYQVVLDKTKAKTVEEKVKSAQDIINILKDIPMGETRNIGGEEYTGIGEDKNHLFYSETDRNGNVTYVTKDKTTGAIVSSVNAGRIGKGFAPSTTAPGGPNSQFKNDLDAIIGNTLATIPSKFGQEQFQAQINRARNDADKISTVASVVLKNQSSEVRNDFNAQATAVRNIDKAISLIDQGAKSGLLQAGQQYVYNVLGKDFDPNLTAINQYLVSAIQPYRNSITGAAWGEQEDNEYKQLFGSTRFSPAELKDRLVRIKEIMKDKSSGALNTFVNPMDTYSNPFIQGNQSETVQMQGADGQFNVPLDQVDLFKQNGYTTI